MILAVVLFVGVVCSAILLGGPIFHFIDPPSVLFTSGCVFSATLWSFDLDKIGAAFNDAFVGKETSEERALQAHQVFTKMADFSVASGLLGSIIGLVHMLSQLDDPTAIGPAMAVALLTLLYGVLLGEFCFSAMGNNALSQNNLILDRQSRRGFSTVYLAGVGLFLVMLCFFVMLTAMCDFSA